MKREEYRQGILADIRTVLPKGETKPCMRGVLDLDLYNRTGKVEMIEPFKEFVSPVVENGEEHPPNQIEWRGEMARMNANKPTKEVLERHLRSNMTASEIGVKYDTTRATVYNWIRGYGLQGIKGQKSAPVSAPVDDMVQHSPTLAEVEQFHTDVEDAFSQLSDSELVHVERQWDAFKQMNTPEPIGMTAEENMSDEEWETQIKEAYRDDSVAIDPSPRETIDEAWKNIRSGIGALECLYVTGAKKSFRERLREMLTEVVGELEEEKHIE